MSALPPTTPSSAPRGADSPPILGLGCSRMGSFGNPQTSAESIALIRLAMDLGVTLFDTANIYGQGDSERLIRRALRGRREQAILVTKAGNRFSSRMRLMRPFKPLLRPLLARRGMGGAVTAQRGSAMCTDWSPAGLTASLDASLRRLGTDHVDLFLLHSPPAEVINQPEVGAMLIAARDAGKARAGIACDDSATLDAALALPQVTALELPWDILDTIRKDGRAAEISRRAITVIAREVLVLQPDIAPLTAIGNAIALPFVTTTLVGTRRADRLRAIAGHFGSS